VGAKRKLSREQKELHRQIMFLEAKDDSRREKFHMKSMSAEDYLAMKLTVDDEYEQQQLAKRRKWEVECDDFDRECRALDEETEASKKRTASARARLDDMNKPERDGLDVEKEVTERRKALEEFRDELHQHRMEVYGDASATEKWSLAYCTAAGYAPSLEEYLALWRRASSAANRLKPPDPQNERRHYFQVSARKLWLDKVWSTRHGNPARDWRPNHPVPQILIDLTGMATITFDEQHGLAPRRAHAEWSGNTSDYFVSMTMWKDLGLYVDTTIKAPWDELGDARYDTGPLGLRGTVITI